MLTKWLWVIRRRSLIKYFFSFTSNNFLRSEVAFVGHNLIFADHCPMSDANIQAWCLMSPYKNVISLCFSESLNMAMEDMPKVSFNESSRVHRNSWLITWKQMGQKYSRMDQVKFVEASLQYVCLRTPYPFKIFKGFLPRILLGPFLNNLTQMILSFSASA